MAVLSLEQLALPGIASKDAQAQTSPNRAPRGIIAR